MTSKAQRLKSFKYEWEMREALMRLDKREEEEIETHRRDILHIYSLTEEDLDSLLLEAQRRRNDMKPRIVAHRSVNTVEDVINNTFDLMRKESENLPFGKAVSREKINFVDEKNNPITKIELVEWQGTYRVRLIS